MREDSSPSNHWTMGENMSLTNELVINRLPTTTSEKGTTVKEKIIEKLQSMFSKKTMKKRLPCLKWLPEYKKEYFLNDFVAGLTVGLLIIPQALAYGVVAGLSSNYGLYSAFMGCIVYFFLGSTRELSIGPTAIMSLMTYNYSRQGGADYAVFLCFVSGVIEIIAAVGNLGFLINFISEPVISGFTSAAAITIASSQLKGLFGLKLNTGGVFDTWYQVSSNVKDSRWPDLVLGFSCIALITFMKEMRRFSNKFLNSWGSKAVLYLSLGRNAIVVFAAALIAFQLDGYDQPFTLTGDVTPGIPIPHAPPMSTIVNNVTMNFVDMISDIGLGIVMVPFIAVLDNVAVVSSISKGRPFDATQEILSLGVITVAGSFFRSLPPTASLSRTAVNITSGVQTPVGGLVTGTIVLLALAFLTPFFKFIPKATLAAVIICAVLHMFDYEIVKPLWKSKKIDIIPLLATFVACLFIGLEWGILLGIGVNVAMMLVAIATPPVLTTLAALPGSSIQYVLVTPTMGIFYPSTLHIQSAILKAGLQHGGGEIPVVVNCTYLVTIDYTTSKGLKGTIEDFKRRGQPLIFLNLSPSLKMTVKPLTDMIHCNSLCDVTAVLSSENQ